MELSRSEIAIITVALHSYQDLILKELARAEQGVERSDDFSEVYGPLIGYWTKRSLLVTETLLKVCP